MRTLLSPLLLVDSLTACGCCTVARQASKATE
jgi:hypothetical protein